MGGKFAIEPELSGIANNIVVYPIAMIHSSISFARLKSPLRTSTVPTRDVENRTCLAPLRVAWRLGSDTQRRHLTVPINIHLNRTTYGSLHLPEHRAYTVVR